MLLALVAIIGITIALSSSSKEKKKASSPSVDDLQKQIDKAASANKDLPKDIPLDKQPTDAIVGHGYGGRHESEDLPPEYPTGDDYGPEGDMDKMPSNLHDITHNALVGVKDPADLLDIADAVDGAGFPIAAVRIKRKALRLVAETGESTLDD